MEKRKSNVVVTIFAIITVVAIAMVVILRGMLNRNEGEEMDVSKYADRGITKAYMIPDESGTLTAYDVFVTVPGYKDNIETSKTAEALGADTVRAWLGRTGSERITPAQYADLLEETKKLSGIAAEYGRTLAFEFHGKTLNDNGESSVAFLSDCAKENVKTYWQPLSYSENEKNLSLVLPYLCAVHVFTWDDEYRRYPLADGTHAWKKYLQILKDADISTKLIMEFVKDDDAQRFLTDSAVLREWIR